MSSATHKKRNRHCESLKMLFAACSHPAETQSVIPAPTGLQAPCRSPLLLIWVAPRLLSFLNHFILCDFASAHRLVKASDSGTANVFIQTDVCTADREVMKRWMTFFFLFLSASPGSLLSVSRNFSARFPVCCREAKLQFLHKHGTLGSQGCTFY